MARFSEKELSAVLRKVNKGLPTRFRVAGFSKKELSAVLRKVNKGPRENLTRFQVLKNKLIDEWLAKQNEAPIDIFDSDLNQIACGFGAVVRENAGIFTSELCELDALRGRLSAARLRQLGEAASRYIEEMTSAVAAKHLLEDAVLQYFTISNKLQAEMKLSNYLRERGLRKLLLKNSEEALDYARTKFHVQLKTSNGGSCTKIPLPDKKRDLSEYFDAARLTPRQREVLSLRLERGMSVSAIARRFGLHRKTVQECIARATLKIEISRQRDSTARRRAAHDPEKFK